MQPYYHKYSLFGDMFKLGVEKVEKNTSKIREEILKKVRSYYIACKNNEKQFIPGEDLIPFARRIYDDNELIALVDSALDFWLTAGKNSIKFEQEFCNFYGIKSCSLVNSGSSANLLALTAFTSNKLGEKKLKPGDEVITIAAAFPTTVNPIIQNNLVPVFVDIDLCTYNINIEQLKKAITPQTKAIMLAHTLGNPFDLDSVMEIVKENDLYLIEDTCDAVGSTYNNKLVGTFGDAATVSFYPAHHMTMGEGGAVLLDSIELERIVRSFRDWGRDCFCEPGQDNSCGHRFKQKSGNLPYGYDHKYIYSHLGYNLKMLDLQPAIGLAQLKKLPIFIQKRKENFQKLKNGLKQYQKHLILPEATKKSDPSWFGFPLTIRETSKVNRSQLINFLEERKIMTRMLFAGNIVRQPAYQNLCYKVIGDLKNTDYIMNNTFFIGVYPGIDQKKIDYILNVFDIYFNSL